jgi:hypothetical protein
VAGLSTVVPEAAPRQVMNSVVFCVSALTKRMVRCSLAGHFSTIAAAWSYSSL